MADYEAVNGVVAGSIQAVNGVVKSSIQAVNGATTPASGASRWAAIYDGSGNDFYIGHAANSDLGSWTLYSGNTADPHGIRLVYGKDSNGNPKWVAVVSSNNPEIMFDDDNDITDGATWGTFNITTGNLKQRAIGWGNNMFVSIGDMTSSNKYVYRSNDGEDWQHASRAPVDISGLTSISTTNVTALATDGAGSWLFGQDTRVYKSTDDGASWALESTPGGEIKDIVYTNSTWVLLRKDSGYAKLQTAAAVDMSSASLSWGTATALSGSSGDLSQNAARMAGAGGRVIAVAGSYCCAANVGGTTVTVLFNGRVDLGVGSANCIATDGTTWLVGHDSGTPSGAITKSTDGGENWSTALAGTAHEGNRKVEDIKADVYLPL